MFISVNFISKFLLHSDTTKTEYFDVNLNYSSDVFY